MPEAKCPIDFSEFRGLLGKKSGAFAAKSRLDPLGTIHRITAIARPTLAGMTLLIEGL
jgi:hypothetical protein